MERHVYPPRLSGRSEMKWYSFDATKGSRQKRPPERKYVLVCTAPREKGLSEGIAVGYRKNAAGDKQCPYFVIPGIGGTVTAWCDCLPDELAWPTEQQRESWREGLKNLPTKQEFLDALRNGTYVRALPYDPPE